VNRERVVEALDGLEFGDRFSTWFFTAQQAEAMAPTVEALLAEAKAEWIAEALSDEAVERGCVAMDAVMGGRYRGDELDELGDEARACLRAALGGGEK
jgi:hypothetical protein